MSTEDRLIMGEKKSWTVRPMRVDDIEKCLLIWSRVELTEAQQTVASCLATDPNGFYVAELNDSDGEIVGMCAAVLVNKEAAFVGFYGVEPIYQGIGIGRELWSKCFERLNSDPSINIGLYGVPNMTEKYKKIGFKLEDSIRMIIYESERNNQHNLNLNSLKSIEDLSSESFSLELINKNTNKTIRKLLIDYDENVQKFSRENLLEAYLFEDDAPLTFALIKTNNQHRISAYSTTNVVSHNSTIGSERKSSCCARAPNQEAIIEDETLSTTTKSSLSISASNLGDLPPSRGDLGSTVGRNITTSREQVVTPSSIPAGPFQVGQQIEQELVGYGVIRRDNNLGGIIGPIYANSNEFCEIILKALIENFDLNPGSVYSLMALDSNQEACRIMEKVGFTEMDQCTRMFTKQIPTALFEKVFFVHSPNFTLV